MTGAIKTPNLYPVFFTSFLLDNAEENAGKVFVEKLKSLPSMEAPVTSVSDHTSSV